MKDAPADTAANSRCWQCGAAFRCGMAGGDAQCWCVSLPALLPLPAPDDAGAAASCLCPECLQARLLSSQRG